ncbi:hypothetical protein [Holdemanella sp.]|uniref:hypothetical protein n=1 Tax=Holdemanella sp. TaxID=1971762 RepID=UPI0027BAECF2|nr:hypothetical protein [Holdemanella sp.]
MTNESYWEYHEMKEAISGTDEHFCKTMEIERGGYLEAYVGLERVLARHSYDLTLLTLDLLYKLYGANCVTLHIKNITEGKEK